MNDTNKEAKPFTLEEVEKYETSEWDWQRIPLGKLRATVEALEAARREAFLLTQRIRETDPTLVRAGEMHSELMDLKGARRRELESVAEAVREECLRATEDVNYDADAEIRARIRALDVTRIVARVLGGSK